MEINKKRYPYICELTLRVKLYIDDFNFNLQNFHHVREAFGDTKNWRLRWIIIYNICCYCGFDFSYVIVYN